MHRHGHRPMIASGLTRRSLCAAIESSVPSPLGGLRMPPGYHDANQLGRTNRPNLHGGQKRTVAQCPGTRQLFTARV